MPLARESLVIGGDRITALQAVGQGPQGTRQLKQHRQAAGAVEVVIHGLDEALPLLLQLAAQFACAAAPAQGFSMALAQ